MLDHGKCSQCKYHTNSPFGRTYNTSELTTRMVLPVVRVKLLSMQRPFSNCAGSLATSNHLPMNYKGGRRTHTQMSFHGSTSGGLWINLHTSVLSIKRAAGLPTSLFSTDRRVEIKVQNRRGGDHLVFLCILSMSTVSVHSSCFEYMLLLVPPSEWSPVERPVLDTVPSVAPGPRRAGGRPKAPAQPRPSLLEKRQETKKKKKR